MSRCPSCKGPKSKRAELCRVCRRAANAAGAAVLLSAPSAAPASRRPRSLSQNSAFHGKCSTIAELVAGTSAGRPQIEKTASEAKGGILERASREFGRTIESSAQLTAEEMSQVLDWLTDLIASLQATPEPESTAH